MDINVYGVQERYRFERLKRKYVRRCHNKRINIPQGISSLSLSFYSKGDNIYRYFDIKMLFDYFKRFNIPIENKEYLKIVDDYTSIYYRNINQWIIAEYLFDIKHIREYFDYALLLLPEADRELISRRYGLYGYEAMTYKDLGKIYNVHASTIKSKIIKCISKIIRYRSIKNKLNNTYREIFDKTAANVYNHHFIFKEDGCKHPLACIQYKSYELEECIEKINSINGSGTILLDDIYKIESKMYYLWQVPLDDLELLNIGPDILYRPYVIEITYVYTKNTFELIDML